MLEQLRQSSSEYELNKVREVVRVLVSETLKNHLDQTNNPTIPEIEVHLAGIRVFTKVDEYITEYYKELGKKPLPMTKFAHQLASLGYAGRATSFINKDQQPRHFIILNENNPSVLLHEAQHLADNISGYSNYSDAENAKDASFRQILATLISLTAGISFVLLSNETSTVEQIKPALAVIALAAYLENLAAFKSNWDSDTEKRARKIAKRVKSLFSGN